MKILFIIILIIATSYAQRLTSSLSTEYAYPEQAVMFRCVTINSPILAWSSPEYIGENGVQLELLSVNTPGITMTSQIDSNTVAILSNVTTEDGQTVIESNLRVVVSARFQISLVSCHNVGQGTVNSITFEVLASPAQEVNSSGLYACPGDRLNFTCETRDSPILAWSSDEYIGMGGEQFEILSIDSLGMIFFSNVNPSTVAVLTNVSSDNGILEIISKLSIIVLPSIAQRDHSVTCSNVGIGTGRTITFQLADNCDDRAAGTQATTSVTIKIENMSNGQPLDYDDFLFISKACTAFMHNFKGWTLILSCFYIILY